MRSNPPLLRRAVFVAVPLGLAGLLALSLLFSQGYALASLLFILLALLPFFASFEHRRPGARDLVPIAVLAAVAALGRVLFAPFPYVKPTSAVVIIAGVVFGPQAGFITGAAAALSSNIFFGQGPYTPWQMFAWGLMGFAAGFWGRLLPRLRSKAASAAFICAAGFVSCFFYGWIMDLWQLLGFVSPITPLSALLTFAASFYFDFTHAAATAVFLAALAPPWVRILGRVRRKYGLMEPEGGHLRGGS
jgi:energy-coupling factor transport system substrate-specific component